MPLIDMLGRRRPRSIPTRAPAPAPEPAEQPPLREDDQHRLARQIAQEQAAAGDPISWMTVDGNREVANPNLSPRRRAQIQELEPWFADLEREAKRRQAVAEREGEQGRLRQLQEIAATEPPPLERWPLPQEPPPSVWPRRWYRITPIGTGTAVPHELGPGDAWRQHLASRGNLLGLPPMVAEQSLVTEQHLAWIAEAMRHGAPWDHNLRGALNYLRQFIPGVVVP